MLKGRSLKSCVALVVFFFSLLLVCISPAYADVVGTGTYFSLYCGYTTIPDYSKIICTVPVTTSGFPACPILIDYSSVPSSFVFPRVTFSSSSFEPNIYSGRTLYISYYLDYTGLTSVSASSVEGWRYFNWRYSTSIAFDDSDLVSCPSYGNLTNQINSYYLSTGSGYNYTTLNTTYVTIPSSARVITASAYRLYDVSTGSDFSNIRFVFPLVFLSSWGSDIATKLDSILSYLQSIGTDLNSVLSVLDNIYTQCLAITSNTDTIVSILTAVSSSLSHVDSTVTDIYSLLKDALSSETAELDKESEKVGDQLLQRVDSEQYWEDKNTDTFNAICLDGFSFDDGITGALAVVGNLFSFIWDAMGVSVIIYTFPLMLGLALVIIGRISRNSGKSDKKGSGYS